MHERYKKPQAPFFVAAFDRFVKNPNVVGPRVEGNRLLQFRDSFAFIKPVLMHRFVEGLPGNPEFLRGSCDVAVRSCQRLADQIFLKL